MTRTDREVISRLLPYLTSATSSADFPSPIEGVLLPAKPDIIHHPIELLVSWERKKKRRVQARKMSCATPIFGRVECATAHAYRTCSFHAVYNMMLSLRKCKMKIAWFIEFISIYCLKRLNKCKTRSRCLTRNLWNVPHVGMEPRASASTYAKY